MNNRLYHGKGHQSETGKIIGYGAFISPTYVEKFYREWLEMIRNHLVDMESLVRESRAEAGMTGSPNHKVAYELHRRNLITFFGNDPQRIKGYHSCYSCLMETPQHPLACGHMLCRPCVQMLGHVTDKNTVTVDSCPFESKAWKKISPCSIRFKPEFAGIRILSLDGYAIFLSSLVELMLMNPRGGMRGIVELESLRAIERVLGRGLPIQAFFDLIVGTR